MRKLQGSSATNADVQRRIDEPRFAQSPARVIDRFMEEFEQNPDAVPQHILKALYDRFNDVVGKGMSLEEAFGGQVRRQLNDILRERDVEDTNFAFGWQKAQEQNGRLAPTTVEHTVAEMSDSAGIEEADIKKRLRQGRPSKGQRG